MHSFMKSVRAAAMLLATGLAATCSSAFAQLGNPQGAQSAIAIPVGVITSCGVTSTTTINSTVFPSTTATATGLISFNAVAQSGDGQRSSSTQSPVSFSATANSQTLGTITWSLDQSRAATPTTVTANQDGADFPATSTINIPVQATISSQPGKTYRSIGEVQFTNPNLRSFNPQNNESYNQVGVASFEDAAAPGIPVFTIPVMTIVVNGNVAPTPIGNPNNFNSPGNPNGN
jgi:hypothetical protein